MSNIKIRTAIQSDLETLLHFEQGIIAHERPLDECLKPGKISYYDIKSMIDDSNCEVLVAEIDGKLIGSAYAQILKAKDYLIDEYYSYLGFMYVDPEYRGQGVNRKIIDGLKAWSKSKDVYEIRLEVYHNNPPALRAYEKVGFTKNLVEMRLNLRD